MCSLQQEENMRREGTNPPWTPFEHATVEPEQIADSEIVRIASIFNMTPEAVREVYKDITNDYIVLNSIYQVNIRKWDAPGFPPLFHLSIKRRDKDRVGKERYRDFLRIKNELVGEEHEGVELYPAMSRNVDTANQYHLWVLADGGVRWPFGWTTGAMTNETLGNARQHPHDQP
jgi:hypothetical protein